MIQEMNPRIKKIFLIAFFKEVLNHSRDYNVEILDVILKLKEKKKLKERLEKNKKEEEKLEDIIEIKQKSPITHTKRRIKKIRGSPFENLKRLEKNIELKKPKNDLKLSHVPKIKRKTIYMQNLPSTKIPLFPLPESVSDIKPIPAPIPINLGKLNPLLNDPTIQSIECFGPEKNLVIKRFNSKRPIREQLSEEEIFEIVKTFSEKSKIPLIEDTIFRVAVGNLMIAAILSNERQQFTVSKMIN